MVLCMICVGTVVVIAVIRVRRPTRDKAELSNWLVSSGACQ